MYIYALFLLGVAMPDVRSSFILSNKSLLYWSLTVGSPILLGGLALWEHQHFVYRWGACKGVVPFLSGSAQLTMLALVVALAAYLRSVRANALELRDKILEGGVWRFPVNATQFPFTAKKLIHLEEVSASIEIASPFFIILSVVIASRIIGEAYLKYMAGDVSCNGWLLTAATIVAIWITFGLLALAVIHFASRAKDADIGEEALLAENEALAYLEAPRSVTKE